VVSSASVRASVSWRFASDRASLRVLSASALALSTVSWALRSDSIRRASARCSISLAWASAARAHPALGLLPPLGQLQLQRLQVLVALVASVGEQLGRLGALLLGLPRGLGPQLSDLPLGGGPQRRHLALHGRLELGDLVRGHRAQLLGLPLRVRPQRVRFAPGLHPDLGRLPLSRGAHTARFTLGPGLHRRSLGAGLVGDLAGLQPSRGQNALRLPLGLAAVIVGLLLGEPEDLLDPGAQTGEGGSVVLLELLVGVGELLLERVEALLGLAEPTLRVVHPLLGLSSSLLRLGEGGYQPLQVVIHLVAVVATKHDGEVVRSAGVIEERKGGLLLGHWDIVADIPGGFARADCPSPR
jgi:hypothetical protein